VNIAVIDTGSANTRSVETALRRVGLEPTAVDDPGDVLAADRVLLPGVGAFGAAMDQLRRQELLEPLRERLRAGWPTLAVCIGLQLLARTSEEENGIEGVGVLDAAVGRFESSVRVPHMGWNRVHAPATAQWITTGYAYFANSYRVPGTSKDALETDGWSVATCDYAGDFVAAVSREGVMACQFHPELSGRWGLDLLSAWIERTKETV